MTRPVDPADSVSDDPITAPLPLQDVGRRVSDQGEFADTQPSQFLPLHDEQHPQPQGGRGARWRWQWGRLRWWAVARLAGVRLTQEALVWRPPHAQLAAQVLRLHAMAAQGEHVPEVLAYDGHSFTCTVLGEPLREVLRQAEDRAHLTELLCQVWTDQADFHDQRQWHGISTLDSITWDGEALGRKDFAVPLRPALRLRQAQMVDVVCLLASVAHWLVQHWEFDATEPDGGFHAQVRGPVLAGIRAYAKASPVMAWALQPLVAKALNRWTVRWADRWLTRAVRRAGPAKPKLSPRHWAAHAVLSALHELAKDEDASAWHALGE